MAIDQSPENPETSPPGLARTLVRLGLGGAVVGARVVRRPAALLDELTAAQAGQSPDLRADEPAGTADQAGSGGQPDSVMSVATGAVLATQQLVTRGFNKSVMLNRRAWNASAPLRKPLEWIGVTDLAGLAVQRVALQLDIWEQAGRSELLDSRQQTLGALAVLIDGVIDYLRQSPAVLGLVQDLVHQVLPELANDPAVEELIRKQLDQVLPELADDPAVQELIRKQAGNYLFYLQNHPEQVEALIRKQGDTYIAYLNQHPDNVQMLIQGQSLGLAGQVMDGVRERTVTADTVAEMIARRILGRAPRGDLPPPSAEVMRRADATVVPSDFVRKEDARDGR